jgi:hypothetical protein
MNISRSLNFAMSRNFADSQGLGGGLVTGVVFTFVQPEVAIVESSQSIISKLNGYETLTAPTCVGVMTLVTTNSNDHMPEAAVGFAMSITISYWSVLSS